MIPSVRAQEADDELVDPQVTLRVSLAMLIMFYFKLSRVISMVLCLKYAIVQLFLFCTQCRLYKILIQNLT